MSSDPVAILAERAGIPLPSLASSMQAENRRRSKYRQDCRLYCRPKMQPGLAHSVSYCGAT
jgi:hypothetical protein